jgi:hypothetical protein
MIILDERDLLASPDLAEVLRAARAIEGVPTLVATDPLQWGGLRHVRDITWLAQFYRRQTEAAGEDHSDAWYFVRARHALGEPVTNDTRALTLQDIFPELLTIFPDPPCSCRDARGESLKWVIIHLNDDHFTDSTLEVWSRDRIADWVDTVLAERNAQ